MTSHQLLVTRAGENDRATVLTMLAEHLPGADVAQRHLWLYESNPHGAAITFIARDASGTPMGLTSLFPRKVMVDGTIRMGSIGGDGYVRPAFRRRGVATALHRACLELMRDGEVEFMYGAPEPDNLSALTRAGAHAITSLRRFGRPAVLHGLFRAFGCRASLVEIQGADPRVAEIWEQAAERTGILPVRDPSQYAWRFNAPSRLQRAYVVLEGGRAVALCALERRGDAAAIIDFLAPRKRYAAALRAAACAAGGARMTTLVNEDSPAVPALLFSGFLPRERKHFQVLAPKEHPSARTLLDPLSWHYMWADGDLDKIL